MGKTGEDSSVIGATGGAVGKVSNVGKILARSVKAGGVQNLGFHFAGWR